MISLRQLEYIVALDEERHFRKAAQRVHVSQPSLSAQLALLEDRLGVTLFSRNRKGVFPTPAGHELIIRARKILSDVEDFKDFAQRASNPLAGRIRFGTPPTLGPYLLPHIVPDLHKKFPELKFIIKEGTPSDIQKMVMEGTIDIALTPLPLLSKNLHQETIFEESLQLGMAWDHPLADREAINTTDIKGNKVLTLVSGHHLHDQVKTICQKHNAEILYDYEGSSLDALRHMVAMGAGVTFFPELYTLSEIQGRTDLCVKKIKDESMSRNIVMIWRKDSPTHKEFLRISALFKEKTQIWDQSESA